MLLNCGVGEDSNQKVQPVHPKGDQSWVFIGRTDAEVETPVLWPLLVKSSLTGKDPDAMDKEDGCAVIHKVTKSQTQLSD